MFTHGSSWLFSIAGWLQSLSSAFFLLLHSFVIVLRAFISCSLKFVLYQNLLLHLTWFCRRGSKRKLHLKVEYVISVFYSPLSFLFSLPSFSLIYWKRHRQLLPSYHIRLCFVFWGFFKYLFSKGFLTLSFSPYVKRN